MAHEGFKGRARGSAEGQPPPATSSTLADPDSASAHIGAYLAAQRRLRGISREELSALTRIPLRSIERLENGHFDEIDDGFVRGFVRTVASALGLDINDTQSRIYREPSESDAGSRVALSVVRAGIFLAALILILVGVGVVSMVVRTGFEPSKSELVVRRDPVRSLAEVHAGFASSNPDSRVPIIEPSPKLGPVFEEWIPEPGTQQTGLASEGPGSGREEARVITVERTSPASVDPGL